MLEHNNRIVIQRNDASHVIITSIIPQERYSHDASPNYTRGISRLIYISLVTLYLCGPTVSSID